MLGAFSRKSKSAFRLTAAALFSCLLPSFTAQAQQTPPQLQERSGAIVPHVESVQPLNDYQRSQMADWVRDFADLHRYRAANQELGDPVSGEHRVIFFGDSIKDIEGNITSMAELARAHDIALVLSSVTPVNNYTPATLRLFADRPPSEILRLNEWMKAYCASTNCYYLDYFDAMVDGSGLMKRELTDDGLHPNHAGYKIMTPLAQSAIDKTMASR
jgi:hypothetical protein